jgi:hypothetical protein
LITRLRYGAAFVYSPHGSSDTAARSRVLRDRVKQADPALLPQIAAHVAELGRAGQLHGVLTADATLVPVPGRAPPVNGALWVADRIARTLVAAGVGREVWPALRRVRAVAKSAWCERGARPSIAEQVESLDLIDWVPPSGVLVLVDDVVTKGRTLWSAASVLRRAFGDCSLAGFAVIRTLGLTPDIAQLREPVVGSILYEEGDVMRIP